MKRFKAVLATLLALAMLLSMNAIAFSASAADGEGDVEEPPITGDIILDGDEEGASSMIRDFTIAEGQANTGYKYLGFVTLKDATADYNYLQITYTGDITSLRLEFENITTAEMSKVTWFNATQVNHFVTADGSSIPLAPTEETTIVIDLEKSGIDLANGYDGIHMHYLDPKTPSTGFEITDARMMTSAPVDPTEPTTDPIDPTEPTTETPEIPA